MSDRNPRSDAGDRSAGSAGTPALPRPRKPRRWLRVLLMLFIFGGGFVAGAGSAVVVIARTARHRIHHPEQAAERIAARLKRRLGLTDAQAGKVLAVVRRRQGALSDIRRQVQPRVMAELEQARDEIAAELDTDQKARWRKLYEELCETWTPPMPPPASAPAGATTRP